MCVDDRSDCRDKETVKKIIATLKHGPEQFDCTDEGTISKCLEVDNQRLSSNNRFTMAQPFLIERILNAANIDLRMTDGSHSRDKETITKFNTTSKCGPEQFDCLGVGIERLPANDGFTLSRPFLIERVSHVANIDLHMTKARHTPAAEPVLVRNENDQSTAPATAPAAVTAAITAALTFSNDLCVPIAIQFLLDDKSFGFIAGCLHTILQVLLASAKGSLAIAAGKPTAIVQFELPLTLILLSFSNHGIRGRATASATASTTASATASTTASATTTATVQRQLNSSNLTAKVSVTAAVTDGSNRNSTYSQIHSQSVQNAICWLPRESTSSFTSEGGTQNIGVMSVTATYASIYTYLLVRLLPMIQQQLCGSVSFRGRASRCQLPTKVFGLFSISGLYALWQSHLRLRGSVSIFGDSQIPSTAATQQLDILRNTSSCAVTLLGTTLWFAADSDRARQHLRL